MEEISKQKNGVWDFFKFILIVAIIVIPIRLWIAQPFLVSGASMEPTYNDHDYLIIDELSYQIKNPQKNEVIIFRYPKNPSQFYIKRIMGLPGETLDVNGNLITLGENEYFVMGDNRDASSDSRIWGPVPRKLIIGRALVRLWPVKAAGFFPGY